MQIEVCTAQSYVKSMRNLVLTVEWLLAILITRSPELLTMSVWVIMFCDYKNKKQT